MYIYLYRFLETFSKIFREKNHMWTTKIRRREKERKNIRKIVLFRCMNESQLIHLPISFTICFTKYIIMSFEMHDTALQIKSPFIFRTSDLKNSTNLTFLFRKNVRFHFIVLAQDDIFGFE